MVLFFSNFTWSGGRTSHVQFARRRPPEQAGSARVNCMAVAYTGLPQIIMYAKTAPLLSAPLLSALLTAWNDK